MKRLFLLKMIGLTFIINSNELLAQCNVQIPMWAFVVDSSNMDFTTSSDTFWVCAGDTTDITGDSNIIFLEQNAYIDVTGDYNKFYIKTGAYCEVSGNYDTIYYESGATISNGGVGSNNSICAPLIFDYSNAPTNEGCGTTFIAIDKINDNEFIFIYPNPFSVSTTIELPSEPHILTIYDIVGNKVREDQVLGTTVIERGDLANGVYVIEVRSERQTYSGKLVVE